MKKILATAALAVGLTTAMPTAPVQAGANPYLGEISWFAGNFAPRGWAFCDGQLLPISQYSALFSLLGTIYGGDGRTTFALPDMRGRAPVHAGSGKFNHGVNFYRHTKGQGGHTDRCAGVFASIAQHFNQKIGGAVDHSRMFGEFRRAVDETLNFQHLRDPVQIAQGLFCLCQNVDRTKTGCCLTGCDIGIISEFCNIFQTIRAHRDLA